MKRQLLTGLITILFISAMAQRVNTPLHMRDKAMPKVKATDGTINFSRDVLPANTGNNNLYLPEEEAMGMTHYDLQTLSSMQNRIYRFDDGTIGGVYTYGLNHPGFDDRGTGYNYYDGSSWGPMSTERIELAKAGWPAYAPFGENGEIVVSHYFGSSSYNGLAFSYRNEKGFGDWNQFDFLGPAGEEDLLWPRMTTAGVNHSVIHLIALTRPESNDGMVYQGVDGAILYSRSVDGSLWDPFNVLLDDINADFYLSHNGDTYEIQAQGDNVAFLLGDSFVDLTLMKSTDGGDSWEKTVIWECPYPMWDPGNLYPTDTFYCVDGAHALAFGPDGKVHVAFGINRTYSDGAGTFWFPLVDGLGYWNEDRPTFSGNINALNPYGHPDTELVEDYSLVGWAQDINGNGEWDILGEPGTYYLGASSMPTITVDDQNRVFVVYAGITEGFDNGFQDFRHLWGRASYLGGDWWGPFVDMTSNITHLFDECVFPSLSSSSDDYVYLNYQLDIEPGMAVLGDEDLYTDNTIVSMKIEKPDFFVNVNDQAAISRLDVKQNQPNPFNGKSTIRVNVHHSTELSLEVTNMMGQVVYSYDAGRATVGINILTIDGSQLSKGVYFYTVRAGEAVVTKKMIIE